MSDINLSIVLNRQEKLNIQGWANFLMQGSHWVFEFAWRARLVAV